MYLNDDEALLRFGKQFEVDTNMTKHRLICSRTGDESILITLSNIHIQLSGHENLIYTAEIW